MAIACRKCQAKIIDMQKQLEEIEATENIDGADVRTLAKLLHQTLSMIAGHADALPDPAPKEERTTH